MFCSVVKHTENGLSTKEVQGEMRDIVECVSPLLEWNLADDMIALGQLYVLYSDRACSFNQ